MVESDNLNPKYIKAEVEVRTEAIVKETIRIETGQTTDQVVGKTEIDLGLSAVIEGAVSEIIPEDTAHRIAEKNTGIIGIEMMVTIEVGTGLKKNCFQEIIAVIELEV